MAFQLKDLSEQNEVRSGDIEFEAEMPSNMRVLLGRFFMVLEEPKTLPPSREFEYHISLKEKAKPVNVAPYRYAYHQKTEIEKQVNNMLANGLIYPRTSPFSSLILLVKQKDRTYRFCTNYRALNDVTSRIDFSFLPLITCWMSLEDRCSSPNLT